MDFANQLMGIAGIVMLVIGLLYAISIIITAMKGTASDKASMQLLRIIMVAFMAMFALDYLAGRYDSSHAAMWVFSQRLSLAAAFGIVLMAGSGIAFIIVRFISSTATSKRPELTTIRRCFFHGLILAAIAFVLRWVMIGYV